MTDQYIGGRNSALRVMITASDDSQTEQYLTAQGLYSETFTQVMKVQQHGFSSNPPSGSHAVGLAPGSRRDQLLILGGEHPDHRPTGLAAGDSIQYNATSGTSVKCEGGKVIISAGGTTVTISAAGIEITGGSTLTHNGVNISQNHVHVGVTPGPADTGVPA